MPTKGRTWRKRRCGIKVPKVEKAISLAHEQEYVVLFRWAKQNGVEFHKMKPYVFPDIGRGLIATRQIDVGDLLISVPKPLLIDKEMLRHAYFNGIPPTKLVDLSTMDLLCLFLIFERSLRDESFWFPYISMLPAHFNTPVYFNNQELECSPEFFVQHSVSQSKSIKACFTSLNEFVSRNKMKNLKMTLADVSWAWHVVNTRSVYMNSGSSMFDGFVQQQTLSCSLAPLLDLLNHSCDVQTEAGFSDTEQCYQIHTKTKFRKGDQVFINYGPHSNRRLLMEYGFTLPNNCHNTVKIDSELVCNIVSKSQGTITRTKNAIISKYNLKQTYFCSPNGLSWSLKTALKILSLNDAKLQQKSIHIDNLELSMENRNLVRFLSKEILIFILNEYSKDIGRICANFRRSELSERMEILVELLNQEMNIVKSALVSLE